MLTHSIPAGPPRALPGPLDAAARDAGTHTFEMRSAYGEMLATETVEPDQFGAALHRFHAEAVRCTNCVVMLDGVLHTRNGFVEFVREYRETVARVAWLQAH